MKKRLLKQLLISGFLTILISSFPFISVKAASGLKVFPQTKATHLIVLDQPQPVELGKTFILSGSMKDLDGNPLPDKSIFFSFDGEYFGQTPTDQNGNFSREFKVNEDAGIYKITAENSRENLFLAEAPYTYLSVLPTQVVIQVTPSIPDVGFMMDGRKFYSDEEGIAKISISESGVYRLFVLDQEYSHPNQRIELGRWTEEIYQPYQDISVPTNKTIQVGINVYQIFSMDFVDLNGIKVDPSRVSEFTIRSLQGDVFVLKDGEPRWFPASRTARRLTGLEETKLYYSVINVMVDGSNVVNQSQQRFYTSAGGNLTIELILYSLQVNAIDGLFGWPVGKSLLLEYPDGRIEEYPLNEKGGVDIESLARGTYFLRIAGVKGIDNRIPVALSRNQTVNMKVITYFDIAVFGFLGLLFVLGLLLFGRPWLLKASIRVVKNSYEKIVPSGIKEPLVPQVEEIITIAKSSKPRKKSAREMEKKQANPKNIVEPKKIRQTTTRKAKGKHE